MPRTLVRLYFCGAGRISLPLPAYLLTLIPPPSTSAIGIQLLPLTAIAESRDDVAWIRELYPEFAESCGAVDDCIKQGWSILQLATLATVGHVDLAVDKAEQLPDDVFESAGGNGHSRTNTMYVSFVV